jgi:quinolinate synthase
MAMNELTELRDSLVAGDREVFVDPEIGRQAMLPLRRMLDFAAN